MPFLNFFSYFKGIILTKLDFWILRKNDWKWRLSAWKTRRRCTLTHLLRTISFLTREEMWRSLASSENQKKSSPPTVETTLSAFLLLAWNRHFSSLVKKYTIFTFLNLNQIVAVIYKKNTMESRPFFLSIFSFKQ